MFSTADDNQTAVTIHVFQGEREQAAANKFLGQFDLTDIPPAPRGMPQIEVTFDIDANGILHVSAKDKATGKEQSMVVKASSGLSEAEIEKMVKDAQTHAEEDKEFHELATARNHADSLIHATEKSLKELGDKVEPQERANIESAIQDLKGVIKSGDKRVLDTKTQALTQASSKMAERLYGQGGQAGEQAGGDAGGAQGAAGQQKKADDNVVDAEFEEVKENKKQ